jgi:hypothetical protein
MRRPWPIYALGIALVIVLAYVKGRVTKRKVEHFALFGAKKMPYSQLITGMFTPKELKAWQKETWDPMTLDQKNAAINAWDSLSADEQNKQYNAFLSQKNSRLDIENAGGGSSIPSISS